MKETINDLMELKSLISQKINNNREECIDAANNTTDVKKHEYLEGYAMALSNCKLMVSDSILELIQSKLTTHPENEPPITKASAKQ